VTSGYLTADAGIDRQTTYTSNGEVATLADGNGNITTYLYDGHDRLNRVNFPNGKFELYGYDNNGNKTSWQKRDETTFSYVYDVTNQLKTTTVPGETAINYIYDGVGRPKEVNRGTTNKTEYGYDYRPGRGGFYSWTVCQTLALLDASRPDASETLLPPYPFSSSSVQSSHSPTPSRPRSKHCHWDYPPVTQAVVCRNGSSPARLVVPTGQDLQLNVELSAYSFSLQYSTHELQFWTM